MNAGNPDKPREKLSALRFTASDKNSGKGESRAGAA